MLDDKDLNEFSNKNAYLDSFLDMMDIFYGRNDQILLDLVDFVRNNAIVDIIFLDELLQRVFIIHPYLMYEDDFLKLLVSLEKPLKGKACVFNTFPEKQLIGQLYCIEYSLN
jgi:hypothetical protein